ncbi:MAG: c-type cytochrome [Nitrospinota bacterium]
MKKRKIPALLSSVGGLVIILLGIKYLVPVISRKVTGLDLPLPVPSTLMWFYIILLSIGTFVYVSSDEEMLNDFMRPIKRTFRAEYGSAFRLIALIGTPVIIGIFVFMQVKPTVASPVALRIQHPSSNFPKRFEGMKNPMAEPSEAEVDEFIEQVKNNNVQFFPQVHEVGRKFTNIDHIAKKEVQEFLTKLKAGQVDKALARESLIQKRLFEGRALYQINCRPCHGTRTAGDGPMAYGFKLRPINFTDNGTIETIVEGYTFWRVMNGGLGLPNESTPWDSAMPVWKLDLSEKERWTIIMGEYNIADKTPRIPEKLE